MASRASTWFLIVISFLSNLAAAEPQKTEKKPRREGISRWALLIGVEKYAELERLRFCGADMRALREVLVAAGFPDRQVFLMHDGAEDPKYQPSKSYIERQLELVLKLAEPDDIVVVAFSGHGVHLDGKSYICPADARLKDPKSLIPLDVVYEQLNDSAAALKLLLVDACRDDPRLGADRSSSRPLDGRQFALAVEKPPRGIFYLASCAPGETSKEELDLGHGVFMHYVLQGLRGDADLDKSGRVSLLELCKYATTETKLHVARKYSDSQRPSYRVDSTDDFDLTLAKLDVRPTMPAPTRPLPPGKTITNSIGMKLTPIPAGEFLMGSPDSDGSASSDEKPQHRVRITKPFHLGVYEVTQTQYQKVVGSNPSKFTGESLPVESVSWDDAVAFCKRLSALPAERSAGRAYRLPTEAEWEYACRAGSTGKYAFGDSDTELGKYAWYDENSGNTTHPVGEKQANAWGVYDMHGNVWEWCADGYGSYEAGTASDPTGPDSASFRVIRGGSWNNFAGICRSADRRRRAPADRGSLWGFRVALVPSGG